MAKVWTPNIFSPSVVAWRSLYALIFCWFSVYDVTSGDSFANVKRWLHEIDQNCDTVSRVLVGNKDDCPDRKVVLTQGMVGLSWEPSEPTTASWLIINLITVKLRMLGSLCVCLSIRPSVRPSVRLSVRPSVRPSVRKSDIFLKIGHFYLPITTKSDH